MLEAIAWFIDNAETLGPIMGLGFMCVPLIVYTINR
jgi:hypothetical protein